MQCNRFTIGSFPILPYVVPFCPLSHCHSIHSAITYPSCLKPTLICKFNKIIDTGASNHMIGNLTVEEKLLMGRRVCIELKHWIEVRVHLIENNFFHAQETWFLEGVCFMVSWYIFMNNILKNIITINIILNIFKNGFGYTLIFLGISLKLK